MKHEPEIVDRDAPFAEGTAAPMRPVRLALQMVEHIAELQPISASELARRLALPKATVHRLLMALEQFGWLERNAGPRPLWSLTTRPISIGGRAIERKSGLRMSALSVMDALRNATGETIHLGLVDNETLILIERLDGFKSVNVFLPTGTSWDLSWSSGGKAVLAHLPMELQEAYLDTPHYRRKSETELMPREELAAELATIRQQGFAISVGVLPASSSSIGCAIFDKSGAPFATISITGASDRLRQSDLLALAPQVKEAARRISMGMSMSKG
jgi:IclR family transcriptional regulator, acetate operon repressor